MFFQKVVDDTKRVGLNARWASNNGKYGGKRERREKGSAVCDSALSGVAWSRHTRALIINELMVD